MHIWHGLLKQRGAPPTLNDRVQAAALAASRRSNHEQPGSTSMDYRCWAIRFALLPVGQWLQYVARISERAAQSLWLEPFQGFVAAQCVGPCSRNYRSDDRLAAPSFRRA